MKLAKDKQVMAGLILISVVLFLIKYFGESCTLYEGDLPKLNDGVYYIVLPADSTLFFQKMATSKDRYLIKTGSELNRTVIAEVNGIGDEFYYYAKYKISVLDIEENRFRIIVTNLSCVKKREILERVYDFINIF